MSSSNELSSNQLRQALQLREQIDSLEQQLNSILSGSEGGAQTLRRGQTSTSSAAAPATTPGGKGVPGKRTMSPAARRRIAAAQKARWAKQKGDSNASGATTNGRPAQSSSTQGRKKGVMTPEGRARLAAAMKARWAARKKGAPAPNAKKS